MNKPSLPAHLQSLYAKIVFDKKSICIDSRKIKSGDIFFGIKGEHVDGGSFAKQAFDLGASVAVLNESLRSTFSAELFTNHEIIFVEDTIITLQELAKHHRDQFDIPVIGITGSNGKTTTKDMVAAVLRGGIEKVFATGKNHNSKVGLPIEILKMNSTDKPEIAVFEMGASGPGHIAELCEFANPTCGVVTTIGRAHIEEMGSVKEIIRTKMAMYEWVFARNGHGFVHADNQLVLDEATSRASSPNMITTYSHTGLSIADVSPLLDTEGFQTKYTFTEDSGATDFILANAPGENMKISIACAIAIAKHFNLSEDEIAKGLLTYQHDHLRGSLWETPAQNITWFADAYNANPESMNMALATFIAAVPDTTNRGLLLGDMLELGPQSVEWHKEVLEKALTVTSHIALCGPDFLSAAKQINLPTEVALFENADDVLQNKERLLDFFKNKTVLAKSSRDTFIKDVVKEVAKQV